MAGFLSMVSIFVLFIETDGFQGVWAPPISQRPPSNDPVGDDPSRSPATNSPLGGLWITPVAGRPPTNNPFNGMWGTPIPERPVTNEISNGIWGPPRTERPNTPINTTRSSDIHTPAAPPPQGATFTDGGSSPTVASGGSDVNDDSGSCRGKLVRCGLCTCCYIDDVIRASCVGPNITDIPLDLPLNITHLKIMNTAIVTLRAHDNPNSQMKYTKFEQYPKLKELHFRNNIELKSIEVGALWYRYSSENSLEFLFIDGSPKLTRVVNSVLGYFSKLSKLKIVHCGLENPPGWLLVQLKKTLVSLDLSYNNMQELKEGDFGEAPTIIETGKLTLKHNPKLKVIRDHTFRKTNIGHLDLSNNKNLVTLEPHAFAGIKSFYTLDLSNTAIHHLPSDGLGSIDHLILRETPKLQTFISVFDLHSIEEAELTYPHHCCAFAHPEKQNQEIYEQFMAEMKRDCVSTAVETPATTAMMNALMNPIDDSGATWQTGNNERAKTVPRHVKRYIKDHGMESRVYGFRNKRGIGDGQWLGSTINPNKNHTTKVECGDLIQHIKNTSCVPGPDAFNPCEDVLGSVWLRIVCWFIFITAIFGNLFVIIVTLGNRARMSVSKLLIFNLSLSDLVLGIYLAILAAFDLHSQGTYFTLAIPWQYNGGCQAAGFLATFSTCLSVFTLTVITVERWYAIRNALDPNKRIRLRVASVVMTVGWVYSVVMAVLPLVGISNYSKTSVCLPMETEEPKDKGYVIILMLINAGCFIVICVCYGDIYRRVHTNSTPAGQSDVNIAKRMALLVATDFVCLFPIVFFGLTAAFGLPLISVTNSKVLLVICFPLNSCANPFLYAIKTKHFRRDLLEMLSRCGYCEKRAIKYRMAPTNPMTYSQSRGSLSGTTQNMIHRPSLGSTTFTTCLMEPSVKGSKGSLSNNGLNYNDMTRMTNHPTLESDPSSPNLSPSGVVNGYHPLSTNDATQTSPQQCERALDARKLSVVMEGSMASGLSGADSQYDSSDRPSDQSDQSNFDSRDDLNNQASARVRSVSEYSDKPLYTATKKQKNKIETENNKRKGSEATCLTELSDYSFNTLKSNSSMDTDAINKSPGNMIQQRKTCQTSAPKHSLPGDSGFGEINCQYNGDYDTLGNVSVGSSDVFHAPDTQDTCAGLSSNCDDTNLVTKTLKTKPMESNKIHPYPGDDDTTLQNNLNVHEDPHSSRKTAHQVTSCVPLNITKGTELRDNRPMSDGYFNTGYSYANAAQETVS